MVLFSESCGCRIAVKYKIQNHELIAALIVSFVSQLENKWFRAWKSFLVALYALCLWYLEVNQSMSGRRCAGGASSRPSMTNYLFR